MIVNLFFSLIILVVGLVNLILPTINPWPDEVFETLDYFSADLSFINLFLPADTLFNVILFLLGFILILLSTIIVKKIINFIRGSGEI